MTGPPRALRFTVWLAVTLAAGCSAGHRPASMPTRDAVAPSSQPGSLAQARDLFYRAVEGDTEALSRCEETLADLPAEDPKVQAYHGACQMLRSARARLPWEKGKLAKAGLVLLDGAVAAAPSDAEVRFVRGMTCYNLPALFNRSSLAARDLAEVAERAEAASADGTLTPALAAASLYHYGVIQSRAGDKAAAASLWRRAVALAPTSRAGQRATEALARP